MPFSFPISGLPSKWHGETSRVHSIRTPSVVEKTERKQPRSILGTLASSKTMVDLEQTMNTGNHDSGIESHSGAEESELDGWLFQSLASLISNARPRGA
jgi:hypothetical protein